MNQKGKITATRWVENRSVVKRPAPARLNEIRLTPDEIIAGPVSCQITVCPLQRDNPLDRPVTK